MALKTDGTDWHINSTLGEPCWVCGLPAAYLAAVHRKHETNGWVLAVSNPAGAGLVEAWLPHGPPATPKEN